MTPVPEAPEANTARLPLPPGSAGLPLIGESLAFLRSTTDFADRRRMAYGPILRSHIFGGPAVFLAGPERTAGSSPARTATSRTAGSPAFAVCSAPRAFRCSPARPTAPAAAC